MPRHAYADIECPRERRLTRLERAAISAEFRSLALQHLLAHGCLTLAEARCLYGIANLRTNRLVLDIMYGVVGAPLTLH